MSSWSFSTSSRSSSCLVGSFSLRQSRHRRRTLSFEPLPAILARNRATYGRSVVPSFEWLEPFLELHPVDTFTCVVAAPEARRRHARACIQQRLASFCYFYLLSSLDGNKTVVKQSLTSLKLICVGSTHGNLQIIPLDQIQIWHGLNSIKIAKCFVLLTGNRNNP